jgi:cytoskeletal protein RodZ
MPNLTKRNIAIALLILVAVFLAGRFSRPAKVVTETKIVEVEKKTSDTTTGSHKDTTTTTVTNKDGTQTTTTHAVEDTGSHTHSTEANNTSTDISKTVINSDSRINLSVLGGAQITSPSSTVFGGAASKKILGPVTAGVWGLSNGIVGLSLGLSF